MFGLIKQKSLGMLRPAIKLPLSIKEDTRLSSLEVELPSHSIANLKVLDNRESLLSVLPKGGRVVEVGVAEGKFSESILKICRPETLALIDMWESADPMYGELALQSIKNRLANEMASGQVEIRRGISWEQLAKLPTESVDWFYIDAAHNYDSVKKDLESCLPALRPNGMICGHDYIRWARGPSRYGVIEAVNEFMLKHQFEMLYLTNERHRHLSYAIRSTSARDGSK